MAQSPSSRTHVRWVPILALVAVGTMINYLDRTVLGIAAPFLTRDLGLSAAKMGLVFSAFSWSYALLQIPGGIFLDRFGTRPHLLHRRRRLLVRLYRVDGRRAIAERVDPDADRCGRLRSTLLSGEQPHPRHLVSSTGASAGELDLFVWPVRRARVPQRAAVLDHAAGRMARLFFVVGGFGIVFGLAWRMLYHDPAASVTANRAEIEYIEDGGGGEFTGEPVRFKWRHIVALLRCRQVLGASLGQFGGNSTQVFFVTWFPTYLVTARGMTFIQAGLMTSLPYIGASAGVLAGGLISDSIFKRTGSANLSRKLPIVGGMLLASTIVAANYVPAGRDGVVILIMSIAFFGQGMTNLGWTVVSDVAPKKLIGLTSGIFNFSANLGGYHDAVDHRHRLRPYGSRSSDRWSTSASSRSSALFHIA